MPKRLHRALAKSARKKHLKGKRYKAYVYLTMNRIETQRIKHHKRNTASTQSEEA